MRISCASREGLGVLDRVQTEASAAADASAETVAVACAGTVNMAFRRLEELDRAQGVVARALLSELAGSESSGPERPLEQTVLVTPKQLLTYDAVRRACHFVDDPEQFVREQVGALRRIVFWSSAGRVRSDDPPAKFDEVALFNIVEVREWSDEEREADSNVRSDTAAVHWLVRGGLWAGSHLRQPCRGPLCRIAQASLEPKREPAASLVLRIGSMLMAGGCPRAVRLPVSMTIEALLTNIGRLPVPHLRTTPWARRTADDLRVAAAALQGAGFFDQYDMPEWSANGSVNASAIDLWLGAQATFTFRQADR